ncbi:GntR family transcriptional regulator [Bacillota bacterium]
MNINFQDERPIFVQVSEYIEDGILSGAFPEESQIPSTTEISVWHKINPATALKGVNILVDEGVIYKKRGLGMFVVEGAPEVILNKRKKQFYDNYIEKVVSEAKKLNLTLGDITSMIERGYDR